MRKKLTREEKDRRLGEKLMREAERFIGEGGLNPLNSGVVGDLVKRARELKAEGRKP